ncbi:MAG: bifunctional nuclease family protein [bacterium]|nr:bifunctional nuclease family protein [bacterium]
MEKIKLEILGLSSSQSQSGSFALVLGESSGNRRLPIIIGMFEAQAIAIEIEKIVPNRPMTHDLFKSFAYSLGFEINEIIISDLKEGVFFAKIVCNRDGDVFEIDSRPSDAIAIGLRFNVPIYTFESILTEAGIVLSDDTEEEMTKLQKTEEKAPAEVAKAPSLDQLDSLTSDKLQEMLNEALDKEDYERAAKIRDEMNKRN